MKPSIQAQLEKLLERSEELRSLLSEQSVINNQNQFRDYSKEYAQLMPLVDCYQQYQQANESLTNAEALLKDDDAEIRALAKDEIEDLNTLEKIQTYKKYQDIDIISFTDNQLERFLKLKEMGVVNDKTKKIIILLISNNNTVDKILNQIEGNLK